MHPAEKRLKNLKEMLKVEQSLKEPHPAFIADLRLSIKQAKQDVERTNAQGYKMVEV